MTVKYLKGWSWSEVARNGDTHPTPVVLWHGLTHDCCSKVEGRDKRIIEENIPGIYVRSLQIIMDDFLHNLLGDILGSQLSEIEASIFRPVKEQVDVACQQIANDPLLRNGYNAIGYSQVLT